jgi:phage tail tube protein FII
MIYREIKMEKEENEKEKKRKKASFFLTSSITFIIASNNASEIFDIRSICDIAIENGHDDIVQLLTSYIISH